MASLRQPETLSFRSSGRQAIPTASPRKRIRDEVDENLLDGATCCLEDLELGRIHWPLLGELNAHTHPSFQPEIYPNPFEASLAHQQLRNLEFHATYLASLQGSGISRGRSPHSPNFPYNPYLPSPGVASAYSSIEANDRTEELYALPAMQDLIDERHLDTRCGRCLKPLYWGSRLPSRCQQPSCRAVNIGDDWAVNERFRQAELQCHDPHTEQNGNDESVNYLNQQIRLLQSREQDANGLQDPVDWDAFIHWDVFQSDADETEFGFADDHNDEDLGFASELPTSAAVSSAFHRGQVNPTPHDLSDLPAARLRLQPVNILEWLYASAKAQAEAKAKAAAQYLARRQAEAKVNHWKRAIAEADTHASNSSGVVNSVLKACPVSYKNTAADHRPTCAELQQQRQQENTSRNTFRTQIRNEAERKEQAEREKANMDAFLAGNRCLPNPNLHHPTPRTMPTQQPTLPAIPSPALNTTTSQPAKPAPALRINPRTGRAEFKIFNPTRARSYPGTTRRPSTTTTPTNPGAESQSRAGRRLRKLSSLLADMNMDLKQHQEQLQQLEQSQQLPRLPQQAVRESSTTIDLTSDDTAVEPAAAAAAASASAYAYARHQGNPPSTVGVEHKRERSMTVTAFDEEEDRDRDRRERSPTLTFGFDEL